MISPDTRRTMMRSTGRNIFIAAALCVAAPASADPFPQGRPVEMTVMFGAGSAADGAARYLADGMAKALGVPVPAGNRAGDGGARVIDVPFGEGRAVVNLLGSRIEGIVQLPAAVVPHVKSGDLRVLAALGSERDPVFPDVPTAKEQGYAVALDMWRGIAVPRGVPAPVVAKLQDAIRRTVESSAFKDAGKTIGFMPAYLPADDFGKLIGGDDAKLAPVMAEPRLKKER